MKQRQNPIRRTLFKGALFFLSLVFAASCGSSPSSENSSTSPVTGETVSSLSLEKALINLDRYEETTISAFADNAVCANATWTTANAAVATVDGGKIVAQGVGTTLVTATLGEYAASCSVVVRDSGAIPALSVAETISLLSGDEYGLSAQIVYKNSAVTGGTISYRSENEQIATVTQDGEIKGGECGETEIVVSATYKNLPQEYLTKRVAVHVNDDVRMTLSAESTKIYPTSISLSGVDFSNQTQLLCSATEEGEAKTPTYVVSDESVISVSESGVVTAKKIGFADVYATCQGKSGKTYRSESVRIEVSFLTADLRDRIQTDIDKSAAQPAFLSPAFDTDNITAVYDEADEDINLWKDGALDKTLLKYSGERTYLVYSDSYALKITAILCDKIAYTAQDLHDLYLYMTNTQAATRTGYTYSYAEGYFILANDIDMEGLSWQANVLRYNGGATGAAGTGFCGTLDGRGHYIKNPSYTENESGVIGSTLGSGGIIKNLGVTGVNVDRTAGAFCSTNVGTIENVFVSGQVTAGYSYGTPALICQSIVSGGVVKNAVAVVENDITAIKGATILGTLLGTASEEKCAFDVFAIGSCQTSIFGKGGSGANGNGTDTYFGFTTTKNKAYATAAEFASISALPDGFNEYWSLQPNGLYFGGALAVNFAA